MAMKNIYPEAQIRFSYNVSRSIFMQVLTPGFTVNPQVVNKLEKEIQRIVDADFPLVRSIVSKDEARKIFTKEGYKDKVDIIEYRPEKTCHLYECDGYVNYMKGANIAGFMKVAQAMLEQGFLG